MNAYEFSKTGLATEKMTLCNDRYLLTEEHLGKATDKLKEAVKVMEMHDLERVNVRSVYDLAAKVSTAASRIKRIQLHEKLISQMSESLTKSMDYGSWYEKENIKNFLSFAYQKSEYYQSRRTYTEPWHHIDVLLNRLTMNGTLKSITRNGITCYSLSSTKEDF
jgi:hypothetical protein